MNAESFALSPSETEVFDFLSARGPSTVDEVAAARGDTSDESRPTRTILSYLIKRGAVERPMRGLYAPIGYEAEWSDREIPAFLLLRHRELTPATYRNANTDLAYLASSMRGIAEHYSEDLDAAVASRLTKWADYLEASAPKETVKRPTLGRKIQSQLNSIGSAAAGATGQARRRKRSPSGTD